MREDQHHHMVFSRQGALIGFVSYVVLVLLVAMVYI